MYVEIPFQRLQSLRSLEHFCGAKVDDTKHYVKSTRKITRSNYFSYWNKPSGYNKGSNKIANEIVQLSISAKINKNKVAISSLAPRKDKLNAKAKEGNAFSKE